MKKNSVWVIEVLDKEKWKPICFDESIFRTKREALDEIPSWKTVWKVDGYMKLRVTRYEAVRDK